MHIPGALAVAGVGLGQGEDAQDRVGQLSLPRGRCGKVQRAVNPTVNTEVVACGSNRPQRTVEHHLVVSAPAARVVLHLHHVRQMLGSPSAAAEVPPGVRIAEAPGAAWHATLRTAERVAHLFLATPVGVVGAVDVHCGPIDHKTADAARIDVRVPSIDERRGESIGYSAAMPRSARQPRTIGVLQLVKGSHEDPCLCRLVRVRARQKGAIELLDQLRSAHLMKFVHRQ